MERKFSAYLKMQIMMVVMILAGAIQSFVLMIVGVLVFTTAISAFCAI